MKNPEEQRRLESWKEISDYLRRSIRTCRRWETELGLPIHRLDGTPSARVFAYPQELDAWMEEKLNHVRAEAQKNGPFWTRKRRLFFLASARSLLWALSAFDILKKSGLSPNGIPFPGISMPKAFTGWPSFWNIAGIDFPFPTIR